MSGTLTLNMRYNTESFDPVTIISKINQGDVVVMHSNNSCAHIFHKCIKGKKEIDVFYKDLQTRARLIGTGGWISALYGREASECDCKIDAILRSLWFGSEEETASKGFILLEKV